MIYKIRVINEPCISAHSGTSATLLTQLIKIVAEAENHVLLHAAIKEEIHG